jgi:NAD(P)-dependent dehydrogenase (short-subunit alcohol dehydrogenase family)
MLERGGGYLLQTASAAGLLTQLGSAPYSVTKHAALAFAEWLAITYGEAGLKVSVLAPQAVRTGMTAGVVDGGVAGVDGMLEPDRPRPWRGRGWTRRTSDPPHPEVSSTSAARRPTATGGSTHAPPQALAARHTGLASRHGDR